ncbi:MAG: alpha/beta hydrolase [Bacteroidetes bacterium 4572_128]|nr:MAG: alpha/beta hydrolase [Bacteroidetes bacterium 4572_128]
MTKFIKIDGLNFHYKVSGKGKNIILLHGWACDLHIFDNLHAFLEKNFKTYSIDFPAFGKSQTPNSVWSIENYTTFLEKFVKLNKIKNPILFGHSFGGRVSILFSSRNYVEKLILIDSAGIKPKRKLNYYFKIYTYKLLKKLIRIKILKNYSKNLMKKYVKKNSSSDYQNANEMQKKILIKIVNEDLKNVMPKIQSSTLLIWGENDNATPVEDAKIMNKLIKNSGLVVLKNSGHYSFLEKQNEFFIIVNNFLQNDK